MRGFLAAFALMAWVSTGPTGVLAAESDAILAEIGKQLVHAPVLRADFHQEKLMRALKHPLVSKGELIFVEGQGVLWQIKEPYAVRVLVKTDEVVEWEEGVTPRRSALGANPIFRAMSGVFLAALAGEVATLGEHFVVKSTIGEGVWQLDLVPKDPMMSAVFSLIQVNGGPFVERVVIAESRGDQTRIQFSGFSADSRALDEAERAYFTY